MSSKTMPDPKQVLARLDWVKGGDHESLAAPTDWQDAAGELYDALDATLKQLEAAGLCRQCGEPLGLYCVKCAWPSRRRRKRNARD
jgi:hypothetical protein